MREEQPPSAEGAVRPGAMTRAMRAVPSTSAGARLALRVAVARAGVIEREWILEHGEVTIGRSEDADIVDASSTSEREVLLRVAPTALELMVPVGARGRVQSDGAPRALESFAGVALALDEAARGRIAIGSDLTILFQRIPAPPAKLRAALPLAVQQGLFDRVDWFFTAIAAASFMLHFAGIVALTEADWPVQSSATELDPRIAQIYYAEETLPEERPAPDETSSPDETEDTSDDEVADADETSTPSPTRTPRAPTRAPSEGETLASVETQVDAAIEQLLGGVGANGRLRDLVAAGGPSTSQAELLATVGGVDVASADPSQLRTRDSGHSGAPTSIDGLRRGQTTGARQEGTTLTEHAPRVQLDHDPDLDPEPLDPNWDPRLLRAAVQRRMPAIQRCYEMELSRTPTLAGRTTVSIRVEEIGSLSHVHIADDSTGSRALGDCVVGNIRSIRLSSGPEGGIEVEYPIVFAPQR